MAAYLTHPYPAVLPGFTARVTSQAQFNLLRPYMITDANNPPPSPNYTSNPQGSIPIIIGLSPNDVSGIIGVPIVQAETSTLPVIIAAPVALDGGLAPLNSGGGTLSGGQTWAWQCDVEIYTGGALPPNVPFLFAKTGVYIGNGTSQNINVGFDMTVAHASVFVKPGGGGNTARGGWRVTGLNGSSPIGTNTLDTDAITGFTNNGFSVGSNPHANSNGVGYGFVALADSLGTAMQVGTYIGLGNVSTSITVTNTGDHFAACNFNPRWTNAVLDFGGGNQYCILGGVPGVSIQFSPGWTGALGTPVIGTVLSDNRLISLIGGMVPTHVWVIGGSQIYRSPEMAANQSVSLGAAGTASPMITGIKGPSGGGGSPCGGIGASGFIIGTNGDVNHDAFIYGYVALMVGPSLQKFFASGTKNPAAGSDSISGLHFTPGFIATIDAAALQNGVWRVQPNGQVGTDSTGWAGNPDGILDVPTQGIRSMTADGFTNGTTSMPAGHEVYWFAFPGSASITPAPSGPLTGTCPLGTGTLGVFYSAQIAVTGGTPPYTYQLILNALPPGLSLNPNSGFISGTPTTLGTFTFTIQFLDSTVSDPSSVTCSITIAATGPVPAPPTPIPPSGPPPALPTPPSCITFATAIQAVAARLNDPNNVHWTSVELQRYLIEALRAYNAYTQRYRNQGTFVTTPAAQFYDLPTMLPGLRGYSVKDSDLVTEMEYHLIEPPTIPWTGSSQFNLAAITTALQTRRDQFFRETGAVVTSQVVSVTPDSTGRVTLPANVLSIRRAAWIMANGTVVPLSKEDEWALTHYQPSWTTNFSALQPLDPTQRWPTGYSVNVTPPLVVQLAPQPLAAGYLALLVTTIGTALNPSTGVTLGVPDDWSWVVKWGAMADLLGSAGLSFDPQRAAYAQARWALGVQMARQASVVLDGRVSGTPTRIVSVADTDRYRRSWQSSVGTPTKIVIDGQTVFAPSPPADATSYAILLDVVANMPVPSIGQTSFCINTGIDIAALDAIYDYATHLAYFKEGNDQLQASMGHYERFASMCGVTEKLDQAAFLDRGPVLQQTVQDARMNLHQTDPEKTES